MPPRLSSDESGRLTAVMLTISNYPVVGEGLDRALSLCHKSVATTREIAVGSNTEFISKEDA